MKAIAQHESVVTCIKSCLIFQIPRFMLISKYRVISPLRSLHGQKQVCRNYDVISMMMLVVNSRVLEKFQILNMHFQ